MAAVVGNLNITSNPRTKQKTRLICKPKWDKCNRTVYRNSVRNHLTPFDTFLPSLSSHIDVLQPLSHLNAVLKQATYDSIPKFKPEITAKEVRNRPWSTNIHEAVKTCRLTWWEWRKSGSPTDPTEDKILSETCDWPRRH